MSELRVGIRDLKANLSKYMRRVKSGQTVIITDRGKPIGRIVPEGPAVEDRLMMAVDTGMISWNGQKLLPREPVAVNRGPGLISDLVVEDRDVDYLS